MIKSMNRFLLLGICITLCVTAAANADGLAGTLTDATDGYTITVNYTRTASGFAGIDLVDFTIGSINDGGKGGLIQDLGGPVSGAGSYGWFTATGIGTPAIYTADVGKSAGDIYGVPAPASFVDFNTYTLQQFTGSVLYTYSSSIHAYQGLGDTWYTNQANWKLGAGGDLADIYVTSGAGVSFSGAAGTSTENANLYVGTFLAPPLASPEPSTLVLLATGLIGLAAYAWRKRK